MHASLRELRLIYDRCSEYAAHVAEHASLDEHLSPFWREILAERRNLPSFDEMLVMRRGFTWPIADRAKVEDLEAERAYAEAAWRVVSGDVPRAYFDAWEEPAVGAPVSWSFDGRQLTAGGIVNALTSQRGV